MGRPSLATWLCGKWWTPNITDYSPNKEEIQICSENCPCWHHLHFFPSLRGLPTLLGIMLGIKNAIIKKAWSLSMRRRQDKGIANSPGLGVEHFCLLIPAHLIDLLYKSTLCQLAWRAGWRGLGPRVGKGHRTLHRKPVGLGPGRREILSAQLDRTFTSGTIAGPGRGDADFPRALHVNPPHQIQPLGA